MLACVQEGRRAPLSGERGESLSKVTVGQEGLSATREPAPWTPAGEHSRRGERVRYPFRQIRLPPTARKDPGNRAERVRARGRKRSGLLLPSSDGLEHVTLHCGPECLHLA